MGFVFHFACLQHVILALSMQSDFRFFWSISSETSDKIGTIQVGDHELPGQYKIKNMVQKIGLGNWQEATDYCE